MKYFLSLDRDCIRIHVPNGEIGYVELPCEGYPVRTAVGDMVAVVNSLSDAVPTLLDHHEKEARDNGKYRLWAFTR